MPLNILIVGAGIAGPTLALLLQRACPAHTITIIERAPVLRASGLQLDLKAQGTPIMRKMSARTVSMKRAPRSSARKARAWRGSV
jgi:2-polyprenyl-6-methoxyphenol hydroxylase-like FAD-dependent oxidoreductase